MQAFSQSPSDKLHAVSMVKLAVFTLMYKLHILACETCQIKQPPPPPKEVINACMIIFSFVEIMQKFSCSYLNYRNASAPFNHTLYKSVR